MDLVVSMNQKAIPPVHIVAIVRGKPHDDRAFMWIIVRRANTIFSSWHGAYVMEGFRVGIVAPFASA